MKRILITGATSGIGRELALQYAKRGYKIGALGRREDRLVELKNEVPDCIHYRAIDVTDYEQARAAYLELIEELGGMDMIILNAGVGRDKTLPTWKSDHTVIEVNVTAFAHGCHFAFDYFRKQGYGHIVGMSSIASHLASHRSAAYTASKHFISNYMTGYRQKVKRVQADITITDLKPGFVWSEMTEHNPNMFWVASTEKAVRQMIKAIDGKRRIAYITKRWALIGWFARLVPQFVWDRI
ncbi:MAG: SDR family NAD(P)-dependent oxidoreductase [Bacteroidota bacterium]